MLFQLIALFLMAAFYACHFLKHLSQRRRGIRTNQIGRGKTGFVRWIECTMFAATVLTAVAEVISIALNVTMLPAPLRWLGAAIAAAGTAVFILAVRTMRDSWRAGVPDGDKTELVTDGIFSISRNPAFLGFDLVYAGILLMFFSWPLLAVSAFAAVMFHLQIVNVEEDFLTAAFGEEYLRYRRRVCRYLGRKPASRQ